MVEIAEKEIPQKPSLFDRYTSNEVEDYIQRMTTYLREESDFSDDDIRSFVLTERAGLEGAGFDNDEIKTFTDFRLGKVYDPSEPPEMPTKPYSTPKEFWSLPADERQRIRNVGWLSAYFTEEQMPYSTEAGIIEPAPEPSKIPGSQIIEDIRVAIRSGRAPVEKADMILHAFDPVLDPSAYYMYKLINGKFLFASDILWAAARRTDPTLSKEKDFDEAMLQVLEYNPSGFTRVVGDITEFIAALSTAKRFVKFPATTAPLLEAAKARGLQWAIPGISKGLAKGIEQADNPLDVPFYIGPEMMKWYAAGYAWEAIPGYFGKAGKALSETKAIQATKTY